LCDPGHGHGSTLFNDKALEMLVVLRMNRNFMVFMRGSYFLEIKALQPFNMAVVVPDIENRRRTSSGLNSLPL
jgi:hypothetical protein